ncbi:MAG: hypothetical protein E7623_05290 [Ruminococcaceae bacterium]|nr:hypothetical protein [Oscillospiraceae bacterium]
MHTLPPLEDGSIPDLAINFSGDDDASGVEINRTAVYYMESVGLPYHINAMPANDEQFVMDKEIFDELHSHGCEFALHTNFLPYPYSEE